MTISAHITRLAKAIALALTLAALAVPVATAGEIAVDDYWRDVRSVTSLTVLSPDFRGDDWYRDASAAPETVLPPDFRGDDWYRDASAAPETVLPPDFRGDDWYRDASAAPKTVLPPDFRGDDYYRDAPLTSVAATAAGLDWGDFGIGAGSMFGAVAFLTGLSGIALARRRGRRLGSA
jgi:hypothetical protein